ncbi:MAG: hypothetical protein ABIO57_02185 [Candidatus Paceibacterota bacterium]
MSIIYALFNLCLGAIIFILFYEDKNRIALAVDKTQFRNNFLHAVKNSTPTQATYRKRNR